MFSYDTGIGFLLFVISHSSVCATAFTPSRRPPGNAAMQRVIRGPIKRRVGARGDGCTHAAAIIIIIIIINVVEGIEA